MKRAAALLLTGLSCASVQATRRQPGKIENGAFVPARAAATTYGPADPTLTCPTGGTHQALATDLATASKPVLADGRLCAIAETLLGWDRPGVPPETVMRFLSSHYGLATPVQRITIATLDTDDSRKLADALYAPASGFGANALNPRFGLATQRSSQAGQSGRSQGAGGVTTAAKTKVILLLHDTALELEPVPRKLAAGGEAALKGKATGLTNVKVLSCDAVGKLVTTDVQGDAIDAPLRCGEKPGLLVVEVRGDKNGSPTSAARFAIACGVEPPASVKVPLPPTDAVDVPRAEAQLFENMNSVRAQAGAPQLTRDEGIDKVARAAAENFRNEAGGPSGAQFDIVARLKQVDVSSLLVLQVPVAAPTVDEAQALVTASPINRANVLNREATHAGVGIAMGKDPNGGPLVYVSEILVREQPKVDTEAVRGKLRDAITRKRADARAGAIASDATLEATAQKYADELAATKGSLPDARSNAIVAPLYKVFRTVNLLSGAKSDPMEFAEEPGVTAAAKVFGVGVAQGANPVLGKNAVYVVIMIGTRR
jgi:uncharacterized protein YkwD